MAAELRPNTVTIMRVIRDLLITKQKYRSAGSTSDEVA
jgi:hypothetical protein